MERFYVLGGTGGRGTHVVKGLLAHILSAELGREITYVQTTVEEEYGKFIQIGMPHTLLC